MVDSSQRAREIAANYEKCDNSDNSSLRVCPGCDGIVDIEYYQVCGCCGTDMTSVPAPEPVQVVEEPPVVRYNSREEIERIYEQVKSDLMSRGLW